MTGRAGRLWRAQVIMPALYLLLATYVWVDFTTINRDGLANIGLMAVTLPVTLVGLLIGYLLGETKFILMPDSFGYLGDHAVYYFPAAAITSALLWWLGRAIDRKRARR